MGSFCETSTKYLYKEYERHGYTWAIALDPHLLETQPSKQNTRSLQPRPHFSCT
ncbi:hypothetical protein LguiB_018657 [Lonicera macranthoides]